MNSDLVMGLIFGTMIGAALCFFGLRWAKKRYWWWGLEMGELYHVHYVRRVGETIHLVLQNRLKPQTEPPEFYKVPDWAIRSAAQWQVGGIVQFRHDKEYVLIVTNVSALVN